MFLSPSPQPHQAGGILNFPRPKTGGESLRREVGQPCLDPTLGFPKIGATLLGGPKTKDYSILGSILGSPCFGKLLHRACGWV